ncbi:hypothetical protein [Komagataeibacter europaeus]|uniref:hypothetical protein n=1 Tax=Komagataeibacter europaeus TaxID=33995 RepID=UPI0012DDE4ED|nr:hypothetical protein [Komagataeibacter europaeus]
MTLQYCQNCWFNGLQFGALGLAVGYCARHKKILNAPDSTTCGQQIRKDLGLSRAQAVSVIHSEQFDQNKIVRWIDNIEVKSDTSISSRDNNILRTDIVAEAVTDYGNLDSKIESLSQLKALSLKTARADVAFVSLGRSYVRNCIRNGGKWISGIHLYWWTKRRLAHVPDIAIEELRFLGSAQITRQIDLTKWSIIMLKLTLVDDIVQYSRESNDELGSTPGLLDYVADHISTFNVRRLSLFIRKEIIPLLDSHLNYDRYQEISRELHKDN